MTPEPATLPSSSPLIVAGLQGALPVRYARGGKAHWVTHGAARGADASSCSSPWPSGRLAQAFSPRLSRPTWRSHSNTAAHHLPVCGGLGGHEGSLLLWVLMFGGWGAAVSICCASSCRKPWWPASWRCLAWSASGPRLHPADFQNPFERMLPAAAEGRDLESVVAGSGLVFHPPMLYMGYVGFGGLRLRHCCPDPGRLDAAWRAGRGQPWTTAA